MSRLSRIARSCRTQGREFLRTCRVLGFGSSLRFLRNRSRLQRSGPATPWVPLTVRHFPFPIFARPGSSDLEVFEQVFVERQYEPLAESGWSKADIGEGLIVDCGANVGYASLFFLQRFPRATVIALEPDPHNAQVLRANVAPYGARCRVIEAAVWSEPGELVLASDFRDGREWARQVRVPGPQERAAVPAVDLETVLRDSGYSRIAILKMDIEGAETEVLQSPRQVWLERVERLYIELHDEDARRAFSHALADLPFALQERGELTIGRRLL